jgi:hypothetical protein
MSLRLDAGTFHQDRSLALRMLAIPRWQRDADTPASFAEKLRHAASQPARFARAKIPQRAWGAGREATRTRAELAALRASQSHSQPEAACKSKSQSARSC